MEHQHFMEQQFIQLEKLEMQQKRHMKELENIVGIVTTLTSPIRVVRSSIAGAVTAKNLLQVCSIPIPQMAKVTLTTGSV